MQVFENTGWFSLFVGIYCTFPLRYVEYTAKLIKDIIGLQSAVIMLSQNLVYGILFFYLFKLLENIVFWYIYFALAELRFSHCNCMLTENRGNYKLNNVLGI